MLAYVGSRTTRERDAHGTGLSVYRVSDDLAEWALLQVLPLTNPSFLAIAPDGGSLGTVHGDGTEVSSYRINHDGTLATLASRSTGGRNPVHLAYSADGRFLAVANYATGSVCSLAVDGEGCIGDLVDLHRFAGTPGPRQADQTGSHPHQVARIGQTDRFIVPDKGLDRVHLLRLGPEGTWELLASMPAAPGAGPRHAAFHPSRSLMWVSNELDCTIATVLVGDALEQVHLVSCREDSSNDHGVTAAGIVASASGSVVYVSLRGADCVVAMPTSTEGHATRLAQTVPTLGCTPRFVSLSPCSRYLLAANERSDSIARFAVQADGLLLEPILVAHAGSPVCVIFHPDINKGTP